MLGFNFILRAWLILALLVEGSGIEYGFRVYLIRRPFPTCLAILGEWRGGVSPPRSLRTGREPLGSSGSQYPAVGMKKRPVREKLWVVPDDTGEPLTRAFRLLLEALVFAASPFLQMEVDSAQTVVQRRFVEMTVVVDPTPEVRIYHSGQVIKGRVGPQTEVDASVGSLADACLWLIDQR